MTTTTAAPPQTQRLWRTPGYGLWFTSDTARELSDALITFAIPLVALAVTGDPAQAGVIGAVGFAVGLVFMLFGGVLADRHRRTTLMIIGALCGVVLGGAFVILDRADGFTFAVLLGFAVLIRAREGIFDPAGESLLKDIVPAAAMGRAQAANQGRGAALSLAGGPLGGILLGIGGWVIGLAVAALQGIAAAMAIVLGKHVPRRERMTTERPAFFAEMREGFRWLMSRRDLRATLWTATIINLGFGSAMTTIVYALQQSGHTPFQIGLLTAVSGASMLVGAVFAPALVTRVPTGVLVVVGIVVAAGGIAVISQLQSFTAVLAVLAASVILLPALNSGLLGYFTVAVPTKVMGRANSAMQFVSSAAMPLAPIIAGFGLAWFGRTTTLMVCGGICIAAAAIAVSNRGIRSLPVERGWADHASNFLVSR